VQIGSILLDILIGHSLFFTSWWVLQTKISETRWHGEAYDAGDNVASRLCVPKIRFG
jgi:hypothetical protein